MLIEFFGFPGSGKTTICNAFIKALEKENKKIVRGTFDHLGKGKRIFKKAIFSFLCLFYSPKFFFYNLKFFLQNRSFADLLNITYLYARYSYFKNRNYIVVFDQGLIQAYFSVYTFVKKERDYEIFSILKKVEYIVFIELSFSENKERLSKRLYQNSRAQKSGNKIESVYLCYQQVLRIILNKFHYRKILKINSHKDIVDNIIIIKNKFIV